MTRDREREIGMEKRKGMSTKRALHSSNTTNPTMDPTHIDHCQPQEPSVKEKQDRKITKELSSCDGTHVLLLL